MTSPTYGYEQRAPLADSPAPVAPSRITAPPAAENRRVQAQLRQNIQRLLNELIRDLAVDTFRGENLYTAADRRDELFQAAQSDSSYYSVPTAAAGLQPGDVVSAQLEQKDAAGTPNRYILELTAWSGAAELARVDGDTTAGTGAWTTLAVSGLVVPVNADTIKLRFRYVGGADNVASYLIRRPMIVRLDTAIPYRELLLRYGTGSEDFGTYAAGVLLGAELTPGDRTALIAAPGVALGSHYINLLATGGGAFIKALGLEVSVDGGVLLGDASHNVPIQKRSGLWEMSRPLEGGTQIDFNRSGVYGHVLTANLALGPWLNPRTGAVVDLFVAQDATGGWTITWPAGSAGEGGVLPQPAATPNAETWFRLALSPLTSRVLVSVMGSGF
jgi:hypothetical protein